MDFLSETEDRPIRPDLPWLRNLSWTKVHASQIGFTMGIIIYWGQLLNRGGVVFGLTIIVAQYALGLRQKKSLKSNCQHSLGIHDVITKPWYAASFTIITWGILFVLFGTP